MGAVLDFYNEYNKCDWVGHDIPEDITNRYEIKACFKMNEDKQVYLVISKTNWKKYVLKALQRHCHESLESEYKLSKELSHPGVIAAVEYIEGTDYNYLIREYVEGYTVTELVEMTEEGHLETEELRRIALQLCDILQYLHAQNPPIIHRDIKPDNIIITKNKECKLIDFGISRRYQGKGDSDTFVMGTQFSAPPEQYGFAQTNERSDIYSIGVLIFYMATGSMDIRDLKQYQISRDIRRIIKRATRFSPKERYSSVRALRNKIIKYPLLYKKRRILYAGCMILAVIALIIGLSINNGITHFFKEDIEAISSSDETNQGSTQLNDNPLETAFAATTEEKTTGQAAESGNVDTVVQGVAELSVPNNTITGVEESKELEEIASEAVPTKTEASNAESSDQSVITVPNSEPKPQEQLNTSQETEEASTSLPVILEEQVYQFKSPIIEAVVREQLGKSEGDALTYRDLEQITSLLICGQQRYERWDEHFVYGVTQYMTDPRYTSTQIYNINGEITGLEDIAVMVNLEKLALYNQRISDLTPLKDLHYLSYLGVGLNNISDLTPLKEMKSLCYLDVSGNPIMNAELEKLKELPYLWGLDLGATKVTSVYEIKDLKLSFLSLFECKVGACIGLEEITTLDNLILTGVNNAITDGAIDRVSKLTKLQILKIFGSDRIDLSKLTSLKALYLIDLCGMWNSSNLGDLSGLPISQLYIGYWAKLDLTGIEKLSYVEHINLQDSVCSDYSPLLSVSKLKSVYCNQEQKRKILEQLGEVPFEIIAQ